MRYLSLVIAALLISSIASASILEDEAKAKIVTRQVLSSKNPVKHKEVIFSGSFNDEELSLVNKEKFPNVMTISLKYVNQPTFMEEAAIDSFLVSIKNLTTLKRLSLENQLFEDEHLLYIPKSVEVIDLSNTCTFDPTKYLHKECQIIKSKLLEKIQPKDDEKNYVNKSTAHSSFESIPEQEVFDSLSKEKLLLLMARVKKALEQK